MSEENEIAETTTIHELSDSDAVEMNRRRDWLLASFVMNANRETLTMGITLNVRGTIVTGMLIGIKEYFYLTGELFEANAQAKADGASKISKDYRNIGDEALAELKKAYEIDPVDELRKLTYIHLKDAQFIQGNQLIPTKGQLLWRGRISEVDGFSVGSLSTLKSS